MYNPEVGEYRRGNHNVQSRGWRIPKGQSKCTISEVGEYRRGNHNVQSRGWSTEGAIKMYNSEVREYRRGNQNVLQRLENTEGAIKMYNLRGWRIPKGQSKCTPGEYRRGNQNVQSQRLENTEGYSPTSGLYNAPSVECTIQSRGWRIPRGQSKCTISEVGEYRRGNHNVQSRGWRIPKGQSKCTISEVREYQKGQSKCTQRLENTEGAIKMYNLRGWRIPKGYSPEVE